MRSVAIACLMSVGVMTCAHAADTPKVTTEAVATTDTTVTGQKIVVPHNPKVVASLDTFPPGAALPIHKHPYPHYAYVLEGELTVMDDVTKKSFVVKQGQFLVEMNNTWHHGKNNGTVPVKLLVIDQLPAGATSNVVLK